MRVVLRVDALRRELLPYFFPRRRQQVAAQVARLAVGERWPRLRARGRLRAHWAPSRRRVTCDIRRVVELLGQCKEFAFYYLGARASLGAGGRLARAPQKVGSRRRRRRGSAHRPGAGVGGGGCGRGGGELGGRAARSGRSARDRVPRAAARAHARLARARPELDGAVVTGGRRQGHRRDDLVDDGRYKGDALFAVGVANDG